MSFGEQMKHKVDQVGLEAKAKDFGDALAQLAKEAVGLLTNAAKENQGKIEDAIDKAATTVDEKTGGKHADTIAKVKTQATSGLDKLVQQGDKVSGENGGVGTGVGTGTGTAAGAPGVSHIPGTTIPDGSDVPEDTHSAFDDTTEQSASGNPS